MDINDYKKNVLQTDDGENINLDLRPFGPKESESIEFCLLDTLVAVTNGKTTKKIILICEPTTKIPLIAGTLTRQLKELGQAIEIRPEHRETSE